LQDKILEECKEKLRTLPALIVIKSGGEKARD
jgi:hypothetical protein